MLTAPTFLGFSMVPRNNRRRLVVIVYAILIALVAAAGIIFPSVRYLRGRALAISSSMVLAYCVVSWSIFGKLAKDTVLPQTCGRKMTSLGLSPRRRRAEDDLDEREVAVRNAAYFAAYRAVAVYSYFLWMACAFSCVLSAPIALLLLQLLVVPLLAMVFTLPPAVVLWTEPDVPEEAKV